MTSNQKVAIVTGGSSGIGRATTVALAGEGVRIVVADRRGNRVISTGHYVTIDAAKVILLVISFLRSALLE
jgi:NAD(P)-dependent dehydrogenase (short-subunit alcohol dehydrogenase family)